MTKPQAPLHPDAPLYLNDHSRPLTRRDLISQGFKAGMGTIIGGSLSGLLVNSALAQEVNLSNDIAAMMEECGIATQGAGKIPFICFDLAGGASMAGTNVLVGGPGGQLDFLSTAGYSKQGVPGDMTPASSTENFINTELGLAFHSDSQFLAGILEKAGSHAANINGAVIPARSENDTGNNPHNPMYAINRAGADGELLALVGSRTSESGGNSLAPASMINPEVRPTKVDRPSDVTGLVDVGDLVSLMDQQDTVAVMESIYRISDARLQNVNTGTASARDAQLKELLRCGYVKSADLAARFGDPASIDPELDPDIVGPTGIFSDEEFNSDGEFRKTASVMKLVVEGRAGAGTITMGGYDYHTGERGTGEIRDLRAGRCMGACLEYAARKGLPIMVYVFSDGSVFSNGMIDNSVAGRGKGVWTGDSQQTAASFFLVYNPGGRPQLMETSGSSERHQQIGYMRPSGDVETASTSVANNVNLLVEAVALNYMALHGDQGQFASRFAGHGLGNSTAMDRLTAFTPICNGTIDQPV
ncbi:hypothetical protein [Marinimicrobium sp. ABcell2]|uniref:hypothetical protein n=1 Tax=Marinimicrobium sp. ABcell2 TaxID=3069751 RepID=UPI0027B057AF|nr:hypothetical protein [Marinimicrobium sp. ABcell2]MDQ2076626.1 hypothetical protein [Marinimicrobium sp. ABcell2]